MKRYRGNSLFPLAWIYVAAFAVALFSTRELMSR